MKEDIVGTRRGTVSGPRFVPKSLIYAQPLPQRHGMKPSKHRRQASAIAKEARPHLQTKIPAVDFDANTPLECRGMSANEYQLIIIIPPNHRTVLYSGSVEQEKSYREQERST